MDDSGPVLGKENRKKTTDGFDLDDRSVLVTGATGSFGQTFSGLRYKFRDLEQRLAGLERHVTSEEFKLNRAFRDIE